MNVSELARQLKASPSELYDLLPQFGFDIGRRAIKVDDRTAYKIMEVWPKKYREWQENLKSSAQGGSPPKADGPRAHAYGEKVSNLKSGEEKTPEEEKKEKIIVKIPTAISVRDFSAKLNLPVTTVIRELVKAGILASLNERIDYETANIIAGDLGFQAEPEEEKKGVEEMIASVNRLKDILEGEKKENLEPRPPIIVVMGHVDHGKTRLLDAIRKTNIMESEAGGITQHIGAYQVRVQLKNAALPSNNGIPRSARDEQTPAGRLLTFIDTPGHEAFTVMRSRGAKVADIAILVVAVDDGVQPQTKEAIKIIEAAKLPYVVALNKIDKEGADIQRTKTQLSELGLIPEDWGGKTICVPIAAKAGTNIEQLLDMVLLVADMEKEKIVANPHRRAIGTIVESHVDPQAGPVATLLVQSGTLRVNDPLTIDFALYGKVRAMKDWKGDMVREAPPGMPVRILGLKIAPAVGEILEVPESLKGLEKKLKPSYLIQEKAIATRPVAATAEDETKEKAKYKIIIRADVLGSLEAILGSLERMIHPEVGVEVAAKGLGSITDAEVLRAEAAGAHILGFNVPVIPLAEKLAREKKVTIRHYRIIYDLLDDVKKELEKLLPAEVLREELGKIEVLAIFRTEKKYQIVGGRVETGKAENNLKARLIRHGEKIGEGEVIQLQAGKQNVKDVLINQECGLKIQTKDKIEVGDRLEVYREEVRERKLGF